MSEKEPDVTEVADACRRCFPLFVPLGDVKVLRQCEPLVRELAGDDTEQGQGFKLLLEHVLRILMLADRGEIPDVPREVREGHSV